MLKLYSVWKAFFMHIFYWTIKKKKNLSENARILDQEEKREQKCFYAWLQWKSWHINIENM